MAKFKVAVIVGSNRRESINRKLGAGAGQARRAGLEFKFVQIDDLPIYNQDIESRSAGAASSASSRDRGGRRRCCS